MAKLVTVALPVYRRLDYLPFALKSACAQDYPDLEILVSDNGENGPALEDLVREHCSRPVRIRRNPKSVPMPEHFNQLVDEASGHYFMILSDDDTLSSNHVGALAGALDANPDAGAAISYLEIIDESGAVVPRRGVERTPPSKMSGPEWVRRWCVPEYDFVCFVTNMARTEEIRSVGGYPDFPRGNGIDNSVLLKLCLHRSLLYVPEATFFYRVYEESTGLAANTHELAVACRLFFEFLDSEPELRRFARESPEDWAQARELLFDMTWRTYRHRYHLCPAQRDGH